MSTAVLVLIQVLLVIGLSRLMGQVCRSLKQPLVIGEIIAGIMLGPWTSCQSSDRKLV
jgi:Kef-type K+ transport system membrane component KefB